MLRILLLCLITGGCANSPHIDKFDVSVNITIPFPNQTGKK
jgi:hypothetical protein